MTNSGGATNDLLQALTEDLTTVVREEVQRAQQELAEKARQAGRGSVLLAGAGALGVLAAGTSAVLVVRVLDRFLPPPAAAVTATALYGTGAAVVAAAGWKEIRRSMPSTPAEMLTNIRDDFKSTHARPSAEKPSSGSA